MSIHHALATDSENENESPRRWRKYQKPSDKCIYVNWSLAGCIRYGSFSPPRIYLIILMKNQWKEERKNHTHQFYSWPRSQSKVRCVFNTPKSKWRIEKVMKHLHGQYRKLFIDGFVRQLFPRQHLGCFAFFFIQTHNWMECQIEMRTQEIHPHSHK